MTPGNLFDSRIRASIDAGKLNGHIGLLFQNRCRGTVSCSLISEELQKEKLFITSVVVFLNPFLDPCFLGFSKSLPKDQSICSRTGCFKHMCSAPLMGNLFRV